jgi:murein L,D-transpeptidase YcbB/YkuD
MTRYRFFAALVLAIGLARPASAADPLISGVVASLRAEGSRVVAGATLSSRVMLPELYERRGFEALWTSSAAANLLRAIESSGTLGFLPEDYHLAAIRRLRERRGANPELDLVLTDAFVRLAYHHRFGKVDPERLDADWNHERPLASADPAGSLLAAIDGQDFASFLEGLGPQTVFYRRLREALEEYRRLEAAGGWPSVPAGPNLEPGDEDPRVPALRRRLVASGDLTGADAVEPPATISGATNPGGEHVASSGMSRPTGEPVASAGASGQPPVPTSSARAPGGRGAVPATPYDEALVRGVKVFQRRHGLKDDGIVGPGSLRELNVPVAHRIDQIRASLERARWVQHDLPERFVFVNVAGFKAYFYERGEVVWESRVVVGKPYTETPIFRADMKYVVLNPTWTIPSSIVRNEVLPGIRRDPNYMAKKGYVRKDGQFVQPAGPKNALGRIKLMFPNPHSVYLHDTPSKSFFNETIRTFSHGCVRVEKPVELAALALNDPAWTVEALEREIATGKTRNVNLGQAVPVLVLYWTAAKSRGGVVEFLPDIYDRDPALIRALDEAPRPPKRPPLRRSAD